MHIKDTFMACAKVIAPPLYRQINEWDAQRVFKQNKDSDSGLKSLWGVIVESHLKHAGYDIEQDEPYIKVLGLEGGKAEFETIMNMPKDEPSAPAQKPQP